MNKKIILSFLIILCLLTSINFVLADENGSADTSIDDVDEKVGAAPTTEVSYSSSSGSGSSMVAAPSGDISIDLQVIWNGGSAPDSVDVKILKDGAVVKTVALSEDNDWKATVELPMYDDNGNEITYDVEQADVDGFEASYTGDQEKGFIITNSPVDSPLKASDDSDVVGDDEPADDGQGGIADDQGDDNPEEPINPSDDTPEEEPVTSVPDDQPTDVPLADSLNNDTDDGNSTSDDNNNTQPVNKTVKVVKKVVKVQDKDKKPEPKPMPPAGNPIAVLVLVLIGIVFASMRRRRD